MIEFITSKIKVFNLDLPNKYSKDIGWNTQKNLFWKCKSNTCKIHKYTIYNIKINTCIFKQCPNKLVGSNK